MRRLLFLPLWAAIAAPAASQGFAPAQSRAAEPPSRPARVLDGAGLTGIGPAGGRSQVSLSNGMPVPVPLGLAQPGSSLGVLSARVPTYGATVSISPDALLSGTKLYTYTNPRGGLESVLYDVGTGATVVYDQSVSFSLQNRLDPTGLGSVPFGGASSAAGITANPSFSLQPGQAVPNSGIPLLNQASPSYDYRSNPAGFGAIPAPSSPSFSLSPSFGTSSSIGASPSIGTASSPSFGTP